MTISEPWGPLRARPMPGFTPKSVGSLKRPAPATLADIKKEKKVEP